MHNKIESWFFLKNYQCEKSLGESFREKWEKKAINKVLKTWGIL